VCVCADPPKLAPNRRALERAKQKYVKLNVAAMRLVTRGGLLMTCSCSGAVAQADGLLPMVKVRSPWD
jgi:23S rRNA G2069 N7-methylase RlmK/C1962 C5-methylase RlmI